VEVVPEAAGLVVAGVRAGAGLVVAGVEVVWLLDVELLLPPPPATSAPPARPTTNAPPVSATTSHVDSFRIMSLPGVSGIRLRRLASRPTPAEMLSTGLRSAALGIARPLLAR